MEFVVESVSFKLLFSKSSGERDHIFERFGLKLSCAMKDRYLDLGGLYRLSGVDDDLHSKVSVAMSIFKHTQPPPSDSKIGMFLADQVDACGVLTFNKPYKKLPALLNAEIYLPETMFEHLRGILTKDVKGVAVNFDCNQLTESRVDQWSSKLVWDFSENEDEPMIAINSFSVET